MKTPHTSCWEGKRVRIILKDGSQFVDKFWGSKGVGRMFKEHPKVRQGDIKSFSIFKGI